MERTPVSSTLLNSIGYDADKQVLEVEFKNGGLYTYSGVTEEEHENLMSAPSVGGHFAAQIKRNHPFNCLRGGGPRE